MVKIVGIIFKYILMVDNHETLGIIMHVTIHYNTHKCFPLEKWDGTKAFQRKEKKKTKKKKDKTKRKLSDLVSQANAFTVEKLIHNKETGKYNKKL